MPPAVTTTTRSTPLLAGLVTVIDVGVLDVIVARVDPKYTAVALAKLTPVIVTVVPPLTDP